MKKIKHYGWKVSPYSAKTRSYLQHIEVDFDDIEPSAFFLYRKIRPAVGKLIMPTVQLTNGSWLQDSSVIIDYFEHLPSTPSIQPSGSIQLLASSLIDVFSDEWLPMAALHYRWNFPRNAHFARREFARCGFPWFPSLLGEILTSSMAQRMQSYLPKLGVDNETKIGVEETVHLILQTLETHFQDEPYLLGSRPCLGDFSLYGPLWAHLYRDPESHTMFGTYPNVVEWIKRLTNGSPKYGEFLQNDLVPNTLTPLFECILRDQWNWIRTLVQKIDDYCTAHPTVHRVPRSLGEEEFTIRGKKGRRKLATFVQWKAQRVCRNYIASGENGRAWIQCMIDSDENDFPIPSISNPFEMINYKPVLQKKRNTSV